MVPPHLAKLLLTALAALLLTGTAASQEKGKVSPPTQRDVKYGPTPGTSWTSGRPRPKEPTPVLVSIHGGGFRNGNKSVSPQLLKECLASGISVVAITYRLSDTAIAPAQFHDSARAIQFTRSKAKDWNIDPKRIAATGGSAGAGLSLWLGVHDDLADPKRPSATRTTWVHRCGPAAFSTT